MTTGKQRSDILFENDNRFALWASGHSLDESGLHLSSIVDTIGLDEQAPSRAVWRVQICPTCGKHYDSVVCSRCKVEKVEATL